MASDLLSNEAFDIGIKKIIDAIKGGIGAPVTVDPALDPASDNPIANNGVAQILGVDPEDPSKLAKMNVGDGTIIGGINELNQKIGQSGGFFECTLSVTADPDLIGENYYIYQLDSNGNRSPKYARSGKIANEEWQPIKCLGDYSIVGDDGKEIEKFSLSDFSTTKKTLNLVLEKILIYPYLTSDSSRVKKSSEFNTTLQGWRVFDGSLSNKWVATSNTNQYVGYDFEQNVTVSKVILSNPNTTTNQGLKSFTIQASDNGTFSGSDLYTFNSGTLNEGETNKEVVLTNPTSHRYWRVLCVNNWGATNLALAEVTFMGK